MILARDLPQRDYVEVMRVVRSGDIMEDCRGHPQALGFLARSPRNREQLALVNSSGVDVVAVVRRRTREIERHCFERFRQAYALPGRDLQLRR